MVLLHLDAQPQACLRSWCKDRMTAWRQPGKIEGAVGGSEVVLECSMCSPESKGKVAACSEKSP